MKNNMNENNSLYLSSSLSSSTKYNRSFVITKEIFDHGNKKIPFNLIRSKRQKTSELIIENENEITLRVPFDKPLEEIKNIIQKKIQWILKKQDEYRKDKPEIKELSYLPSSTLPYLGNSYIIEVRNLYTNTDSNSNINNNEKVEKLNDNKLVFYLKDLEENYLNTNDEYIKNKVKELYEDWLYQQAQIVFKEKINKFSKLIEVNPADWQIKRLKNRWGSVTKSKKIVLNINLMNAPEKIIDYVIIHELCHLKIEGHSHNFWNLLHKFVPNYEDSIKWLELNSKNILQS